MVSETEARKTERQVHRFAHAATTRYNSTSRLTHISSVIWRRRVLQSLLKAEARKIRCHRAHEVAHVDEGRRDLHLKRERRPTFSRITPGTQSGGGNDGLVPSYRRVTKRKEIPTGGSNPRPKEREVHLPHRLWTNLLREQLESRTTRT